MLVTRCATGSYTLTVKIHTIPNEKCSKYLNSTQDVEGRCKVMEKLSALC